MYLCFFSRFPDHFCSQLLKAFEPKHARQSHHLYLEHRLMICCNVPSFFFFFFLKKKGQHFCGPCVPPPNPTTHYSPPLIFTLTIFSLGRLIHFTPFPSFFHSLVWSSLLSFSPPVLPHHHHYHLPPSFFGKITGKFL